MYTIQQNYLPFIAQPNYVVPQSVVYLPVQFLSHWEAAQRNQQLEMLKQRREVEILLQLEFQRKQQLEMLKYQKEALDLLALQQLAESVAFKVLDENSKYQASR